MYMPTFYRHWKISNFFFWAKCGSFFSSVEQITVNYSVSVSHWFQCGSGLLKIAICLSLNLHEGRPSYRKSLQPSKENIQHLKTWNFLTFFSIFEGHFWPPGSGSIRPESMRIRIRNTGWFVLLSRWAPLSRSWCSTTCWILLILVTRTQSSTSRAGPCPSWNVCSGKLIPRSLVPF